MKNKNSVSFWEEYIKKMLIKLFSSYEKNFGLIKEKLIVIDRILVSFCTCL